MARDRNYAAAWALLSKTYSRLSAPAAAGMADALATMKPALDAATTADSLAPDLVDAQVALALAYRGLGLRDRMRAAVERAIVLAPRSGEPLILMGDLSSISPGFGCPVGAQPDLAEAQYREGLRLDPFFTAGYGNLVTLLWWMGRPDDAADANSQGLAAEASSSTLKTWRPFNLAFAGRLDEADVLLKQTPDSPAPSDQVVFIRAMVALKNGRLAEADRLLRKVDGLLQNSLALTLITAVAQFQAKRPAEGAAYLSRGVRASPECSQWAMLVPALAPFRDLPQFKKAIR